MAEQKVLIIDDDVLSATILGDWLKSEGWNVVIIHDGGQALKRCLEFRPHLLLVDVVLPGLSGLQICGELRLQPWGRRLLIGLMSGRPDVEAAAIETGADFFLPKPVQRVVTLNTIAAYASRIEGFTPESQVIAPVRVPSAPVLGGAAAAPASEEGDFSQLSPLVLFQRLVLTRYTGVLEARSHVSLGVWIKIFFDQGSPSASRSNDPTTSFGRVLEHFGVVAPDWLEPLAEDSARANVPIGEMLLRSQLMDQRMVERVLREQVLLRTLQFLQMHEGHYLLQPAEPIGLATFPVHPAAVEWRFGPDSRDAPASLGAYVRPNSIPDSFWFQLDPRHGMGVMGALVVGGATVGDCIQIGGPRAGSLLSILQEHGLITLSAEPPPASQREAGLASLQVERLEEWIAAQHRSLPNATHYTVLGLRSDASLDQIHAAVSTALTRLQLDDLPAGLSAEGRTRIREIYARICEAGRVLSDPERRRIYDALLRTDSRLRRQVIGMEDHAVLQAERAREHLQHGDFVTAAALLRMAILLEGEEPEILALLGWARHCACPDDPAAGEAELQRSLSLDPDNSFALLSLGQLHKKRGELDAARRLLREALRLNHEDEAVREALRSLGE